jgi:hypothetical protein
VGSDLRNRPLRDANCLCISLQEGGKERCGRGVARVKRGLSPPARQAAEKQDDADGGASLMHHSLPRLDRRTRQHYLIRPDQTRQCRPWFVTRQFVQGFCLPGMASASLANRTSCYGPRGPPNDGLQGPPTGQSSHSEGDPKPARTPHI